MYIFHVLIKIMITHTPQKIGIIGGHGQMGKKISAIFVEKGYNVLIADHDTKLSNCDVAKMCDVVIISVPIHATEHVIKGVASVMQKGALLTDVTSVKMIPMSVMKKSLSHDVAYIGGHPLFAPSTAWDGQHFIMCEGVRGQYTQWYHDFLVSLGLEVIVMTAEEHDRHMAVIQCLTHFSTISLGSALQKLNYDLHAGEKIATSVYQMRLYGAGRILAQDPILYADIQKYNPYAQEVSRVYCEAATELYASITSDDAKAFADIFTKDQKYFGDMAEKSLRITNKLIASMHTYE